MGDKDTDSAVLDHVYALAASILDPSIKAYESVKAFFAEGEQLRHRENIVNRYRSRRFDAIKYDNDAKKLLELYGKWAAAKEYKSQLPKDQDFVKREIGETLGMWIRV